MGIPQLQRGHVRVVQAALAQILLPHRHAVHRQGGVRRQQHGDLMGGGAQRVQGAQLRHLPGAIPILDGGLEQVRLSQADQIAARIAAAIGAQGGEADLRLPYGGVVELPQQRLPVLKLRHRQPDLAQILLFPEIGVLFVQPGLHHVLRKIGAHGALGAQPQPGRPRSGGDGEQQQAQQYQHSLLHPCASSSVSAAGSTTRLVGMGRGPLEMLEMFT